MRETISLNPQKMWSLPWTVNLQKVSQLYRIKKATFPPVQLLPPFPIITVHERDDKPQHPKEGKPPKDGRPMHEGRGEKPSKKPHTKDGKKDGKGEPVKISV